MPQPNAVYKILPLSTLHGKAILSLQMLGHPKESPKVLKNCHRALVACLEQELVSGYGMFADRFDESGKALKPRLVSLILYSRHTEKYFVVISMATHPDHRRKSCASTLLKHTIANNKRDLEWRLQLLRSLPHFNGLVGALIKLGFGFESMASDRVWMCMDPKRIENCFLTEFSYDSSIPTPSS